MNGSDSSRQGGNTAPAGGQFQATREQLRDPVWVFAHQAELKQMAKEVANTPRDQIESKFIILG